MIQKIKRSSRGNIQDNTMPTTIEQLITKYDLDNIKIYNFLDELVEQINLSNNNVLTKIGNWGNTVALKDYVGDLNDINITSFMTTYGSNTNSPVNYPAYVITYVKNSDYYKIQFFITRNNGEIYKRVFDSAVWSKWEILNPTKEKRIISDILKNSWVVHSGDAYFYKEGNKVYFTINLKNGTAVDMILLPTRFAPSNGMFFPATKNGEGGTCIYISSSGKVSCQSTDVGKLIFSSGFYLTN